MTEDKTNQNKQNKKAKQKNKKINRRTQSKRRDKKKYIPPPYPWKYWLIIKKATKNEK